MATTQSSLSFAFEKTVLCPRCNRPLPMYLQPVHLEVDIHCPRCGRSLTAMIRHAISDHRDEEARSSGV